MTRQTATASASPEPTPDDRDQFERDKRTMAAELASDAELAAKASDFLVHSDTHGYGYLWSWLGVPMIQIPSDIVVLQEVMWATRPTLVVETGIARGGSVIFFASMLAMMGEGRVLGVDIDVRPHNRESIDRHPIAERVEIDLIEGSSVAPDIVEAVRASIRPDDRVMVVLDSNHTHEHVRAELDAYASMVTPGQMLVVCDTVVECIPEQAHRPRPWGPGNNPMTALREWEASATLARSFERDPFVDDKLLLTSSPRGYLRRRHVSDC